MAALKILVAVDGSAPANRAARHAARFAGKRSPVDVLLLNVQPEVVAWQTHGMEMEIMLAHRQELGRKAARTSERTLRAARIPYSLRIEMGDPAETIARLAARRRVGLIIMGTRGMGAVEDLVLGSVAHKVVHLARAPVMLVK